MSKSTAYIGLGSNLANPSAQIKIALTSISQLPQTSLKQCSSLYGSKPLGPQDQPDFINAVCAIETALSPEALLTALQQIELQQGRIKKRHWGERLIDLDILLYGDEVIQTTDLTLPHAQIKHRDFVLVPLAEISPGLVIPALGQVEALVEKLETSYLIALN